MIVIVALLYYATPNVKQPRLRWSSMGAFLAIVIWALLSAAFGFYVANFSSYDRVYGALAGVIVFLLWLWLTNLALLFGAELNAELERARRLQSGIPAEEALRLPPRDTSAIEKAEDREAKDKRRGERAPPWPLRPPPTQLTGLAHGWARPPAVSGKRDEGARRRA